jgi:hybrid cluster-associated redox disulfide protein
MPSKKRINPDTTIEEIVQDYPQLIKILMEYGLKCVACGEPLWGTLQENAQEKGINNLTEIIDELNKSLLT